QSPGRSSLPRSRSQGDAVSSGEVMARRRLFPWRSGTQPMLGSWSMSVGLIGFAAFVLAALAAPILAPYDPVKLDLLAVLQPPSLKHLFGTDQLGRDILSRVIYAARVDLQIGVIGVAIPLVIGTLIGLVAGYFGGLVDAAIGRVVDVVIAFPFLV